MKSYYDLLKNNIIEFDKLVLDKYHLLGLNEIETIILIKLNSFLRKGKNTLSIDEIVPYMSINEDTCSELIVDLVNRGFINLEFESVKSKETFNLDETYRKLSLVLEEKDEKNEKDDVSKKVIYTVRLLEKELKKILSPIEIQIINKWFYDYKYDYEIIEKTIFEALKFKNRGINYIDSKLNKETSSNPNNKVDDVNITDLFKDVYVGKKSN